MTVVAPPALQRIPSGVIGLDAVLDGGFLQGGTYIVAGMPGTGKTILGNQICFRHAAAGGRALYATLLAESHARMLLHLGTLRFFDASRLPDQVSYVSGLGALEGEGLPGLVTLLRLVRSQGRLRQWRRDEDGAGAASG